MIAQAIATILEADSDVTGNSSTRKPGALDQGDDLDAVTWDFSGIRSESLSGSAGLLSATLHVACWSQSRLSSLQLAEYVRAALIGTKDTQNNTTIYNIIREDARDEYEPPIDGTGRGLHPTMAEFRVWYSES